MEGQVARGVRPELPIQCDKDLALPIISMHLDI
jgi:hypothetical protein